MNLKQYLAVMLALFAVAVIIALIPSQEPEPVFARIDYVETKSLSVNTSHVNLQFSIKLTKPEKMENLTLKVKFTDIRTNLLIDEFSKELPEKTGRDYTAVVNCTVRKSHDYLVRILLERDGKVLSRHDMRILGLSSLPPAEKSVEIFVRDADFRLINKSGEHVRVRATYYIDPLANYTVEFHIKAVQLESGVLADESWEERELRKGMTNLVSFSLTLKDGYNYYVVLELWNDGYLIESWKRTLKLNPYKDVEEKSEKEGFRVEDFIVEERTPSPSRYEYDRSPKLAAPGFEVLIAVAAGGVAAWMRRRL